MVNGMDRSSLQLKKRELTAEVEELRRKIVSIDDVLSLFPEEDTPPLKGMGKYAAMGITDAILDACGGVAPESVTVANLADTLKREGLQSKAANLRIAIAGIADRLVAHKRLERTKKKGLKAYRALATVGAQ
jgi:hypothetical protein